MNSNSFILTCDDAPTPGGVPWPDFLGFNQAIVALEKGNLLDALEARICAVENAGIQSVGVSGFLIWITGTHWMQVL